MIYRAVLQDVLPVAAISRFIGDIYPAIDGGAAYEAGVLQSSGLLHYVRNDVVFIVIAKEQSDCGNLRQGRPLFGTLCVPPLPLQRESIREDWSTVEYVRSF